LIRAFKLPYHTLSLEFSLQEAQARRTEIPKKALNKGFKKDRKKPLMPVTPLGEDFPFRKNVF